MDQKLLDALNNLSDALEMISDALKDKKGGAKSPTTQALQSGDFSKQITSIIVDVKSIKKDTQEILKHQKTILSMSQKGEKKTDVIEQAGDKKSEGNLRKGVETIVMIAVGVLAIGLAFKIIGKVDFLSVVALGMAIVLISVAFEKIAKLNITKKQAMDASQTLVIISIAMMLSSFALKLIMPISFAQAITAILIAGMFTVISHVLSKLLTVFGASGIAATAKSVVFLPLILPVIALGIAISSVFLSKITPISFAQGITAILIAGVFTVISFGLSKLLTAFGGSGIAATYKSVIFLPVILPVIAAAIAASSLVLRTVSPISFAQAITSILIAAMFAVIAHGLNKLISAFKDISPDNLNSAILSLPILLPAIALAIAASSWALGMVKPIGFAQFLTALGISMLFVVVAFAVSIILKAVKDLQMEDVIKLPLLFVTMSMAIYLSSIILSKAEEIKNDKLWSILKFGVVLSLVSIVLSAAFWVIKKLGVGLTDVIKGSLIIIVLATTIMLSSRILSVGNYDKYPSFSWAAGVGASLLAFGISAVALGIVVLSGIGAAAIGLGAVAILGIAATIVATAEILSKGDFSKYPSLDWAVGVGLLITSFGLATLVLGGFILGTLGLGGLALKKGGEAVLNIAQSIVDTAAILKKGDFTGGPTIAWAGGVALALAAFAPIYAMLMADGIMKIFGGGGISPEDFSNAIRTISVGIVDSANLLKGTVFSGGPTKVWAEGVSLALGAFAPIYAMLMADGIMKIFGGGGISPEDFSNAIRTISVGIVDSATFFKGITFEGGPTKAWADGVGTAISAFAPVFKILMADGVLKIFGSGVSPDSMKSAIMTISQGIVDAAAFFKGKAGLFEEGSYPSEAWGKNVGLALAAFAPVYAAISGKGWFESTDDATSGLTKGIKSMADAIVSVAISFSDPKVSWTSYPNDSWSSGISAAIKSFLDINDFLVDKDFDDSAVNVARKIAKIAKILGGGPFVNNIDPNFMKSMQSNIFYYVALTKKLTESSGGLANMAKSALLGDPITNAAKGMVKLAGAYDKLATSLTKFGVAINSLDPKKISSFKELSNVVMEAGEKKNVSLIDNVSGAIESAIGGVGDFLSSVVGGGDTEKKTGSAGVGVGAAGTPQGVSKYGTMGNQLDMVIDLLTKLSESTKSLDVYLKEKMGGSGGSDVTSSPSSSSSSGSSFWPF